MSYSSTQYNYRRVFVAANGPFPHPCHFCGGPVRPWNGHVDRTAPVVHHLDEDRSNCEPSNLVPCHYGCHSRHHMLNGGVARARAGWAPDHQVKAAVFGGKARQARATRTEKAAWGRTMVANTPMVSCVGCHREMKKTGGLLRHLAYCDDAQRLRTTTVNRSKSQ